jgi:hypothetical protein
MKIARKSTNSSMRVTARYILVSLLLLVSSRAIGTEHNVRIPKTDVPADNPNPFCSGEPISAFLNEIGEIVSEASGRRVNAPDFTGLLKMSGLVRANHANCQAIAIVVNGTDEVYFNFAGRGREWHPWFCGGGYRTFIGSEWAAVDAITTRYFRGGYLITAVFKNWSHTTDLLAGIHVFPAGQGYRPYPENCDPVTRNNAASAAQRQ